MKRFLLIFLLMVARALGAVTEFYVQTTGSNLNAGSTTSNTAAFTYTSAVLAAGWNQATGVFTVASGNPSGDGVTTGMFASVYVTAGATNATFVGRITAVSTTTITVSLSAVSGTPPATDALGATTIKVGGAWKGPNGTTGFPFNFAATAMNDGTNLTPRINFKNGVTYAVTAAMTNTVNGPVVFRGYTTTVADGGKAIFDGGTSGAAYTLLAVSATNTSYTDLIFAHNGATGNSIVVSNTGGENVYRGCVFHDSTGDGFNASGTAIVIECEAYANNTANAASRGGFSMSASASVMVRCNSHDNAGSNSRGFYLTASVFPSFCIADTNGSHGFEYNGVILAVFRSCDAYNNTGAGISLTGASALAVDIENCNLIKNGTYGIDSSGSALRNGFVANNGYGSGTMANTSGQTNGLQAIVETGAVTYATDAIPWQDAPNGNFSIALAAAKAAGRGTFTETQASYSGTAGFPAIGAAQPSAASTSVQTSAPFSQ